MTSRTPHLCKIERDQTTFRAVKVSRVLIPKLSKGNVYVVLSRQLTPRVGGRSCMLQKVAFERYCPSSHVGTRIRQGTPKVGCGLTTAKEFSVWMPSFKAFSALRVRVSAILAS